MTSSAPDLQIASTNKQSPLPSTINDSCDLLSEAVYQLSFLRSTFVGSEPKELSKDEQHGLCLILDNLQNTIETAAEGLRKK